ncbi:hypothetical protein M5K25_018372 [Dendrobium thyrsiflorum]|uniref:Uncharacterized protein n=1 Tax=Dendrobium thyrsiflorum TaxID=117978 RepID=A0ABD0UQ01_DENTH
MHAVGKMAFLVLRQFTATVQCVLTVTKELVSMQMVKYITSLSRESIMDIKGEATKRLETLYPILKEMTLADSPAAVFRTGEEEIAEFFLRSEKYPSNFDFLGMAAKKVDALEERLEGEMNQIKETVEERMSSMEGQVADLRDMMKKMLEFQTQSAASDAKGPEAKNINSEIHREEEEVEIVDGRRGRPHLEPFQREERGGGYGERQGYGDFSNFSSVFAVFFCCKQQFTRVWVQFSLGNT